MGFSGVRLLNLLRHKFKRFFYAENAILSSSSNFSHKIQTLNFHPGKFQQHLRQLPSIILNRTHEKNPCYWDTQSTY